MRVGSPHRGIKVNSRECSPLMRNTQIDREKRAHDHDGHGFHFQRSFSTPEQPEMSSGGLLPMLSAPGSTRLSLPDLSPAVTLYQDFVIGATAFAMTWAGMVFGARIGTGRGRRVGIAGELILIGIGIRILWEHL